MSSSYWLVIRVCLFLTLAFTPRNGGAQNTVPERDEVAAMKILESAALHYRGIGALCADFTQHLLVPLLGEDRTGIGRLCQAQPNRFAMRFSDPEGDLVLVDGSFVWLYYPSLDPKQVFKIPMVENGGHYDFHREFLDQPALKYQVTYEHEDKVAGQATHRLRLIPLVPAQYEAAVVWIDRAQPLLRQIRIEEENGSVRTITMDRIDFSPKAMPEDWFTFTPPEGAHVISG